MNSKRNAIGVFIILLLTLCLSLSTNPDTAKADSSLKYLSILRVVNQYVPFDSLSWEAATGPKTTDSFQWFEAAIYHFYEDQTASAVHLYKFDETFDFFKWFQLNPEEWIDYRESYRILKVDIPEGIEPAERSHIISQAFMEAFNLMVNDTPSEHYGIRYSGHGSADGGLFEGEINPTDAQWFLESAISRIGRKIDFLDLGSNCIEGRMVVLSNFYPYFDYIMASDLPVGGYTLDEGENFFDYDKDTLYPQIVTPDKSLKAGLTDILNLARLRWEASKDSMIALSVMQSLSLYEMDQYETMAVMTFEKMTTNPVDMGSFEFDLFNYIQSLDNHDEMEIQFYALRSEYRHNKDFFDWYYDTNGLMVWIREWVEPDFSIFPPFRPVLVQPGNAVNVDLLIRTINAFDFPFTFEAQDLPPSLSVTFSEVYGDSPMHVTMQVTTADSIPVGLQTIQVSASGGGKTSTTTAQISVVNGILYIPMVTR